MNRAAAGGGEGGVNPAAAGAGAGGVNRAKETTDEDRRPRTLRRDRTRASSRAIRPQAGYERDGADGLLVTRRVRSSVTLPWRGSRSGIYRRVRGHALLYESAARHLYDYK